MYGTSTSSWHHLQSTCSMLLKIQRTRIGEPPPSFQMIRSDWRSEESRTTVHTSYFSTVLKLKNTWCVFKSSKVPGNNSCEVGGSQIFHTPHSKKIFKMSFNTDDERSNLSTEDEETEEQSSNDDGRAPSPTIPHETTSCGNYITGLYLGSAQENRPSFVLPPRPMFEPRTLRDGPPRKRSMAEILDAALDIVKEPFDGCRTLRGSTHYGLPRQ